MKSAVFNSFGGTEVLQIVDVETPAITADEVLVRIRAAAINPKDTFVRKGRFAALTGAEFPMQTGFDFAGEAAAVGTQAQGIAEGEPVYGMLDGWAGGTCAQFISVRPHQLSRKPANLSFQEAAALPLVSLTALQAMRDEAHIQPGFQVCINGASGGVGSMAVQIAKRFDAQVTAISSTQNHPLLKELGADHCLDYHQGDITHSRQRFDIFFDVFGNQLFEKVRPVLTPKGIWVSTVLRPEVGKAVEQTKDSSGQKAKLVIVRSDRNDLEQVCRWAEAGLIKPVIHEVFPLANIAAAHRQQESKHTRGKLIITIP
jgi:NADPH:quinone reductase-like Zn-dependent oxidoreductase